MPTDLIVPIDFESRSRVDIKLGLERYTGCPECEPLMLAFELDPTGPVRVWHRGYDLKQPEVEADALERLLDHVAGGGLISAFNAMFEWYMWNKVCVPKLGWPELRLEQLRDTMARAAAQNLPQGLGKCAEVLGLPADAQKSKRGKYLIQRLCVPHKPTKTREGVWVQDPTLFAEFVDYCAQDVRAEKGVARKLRPLTAFEQQVWEMTQKINLRGVPVDLVETTSIRNIVEQEKDRLNAELRRLTGRQVEKASGRDKLLRWVNGRLASEQADPLQLDDPLEDESGDEIAFALGNMKSKTVEDALARPDLPSDVRRALEIRAAVVQTSTAKYDKMLKIVADDGTVKNLFVYHGAGPGRWASRGGLNVQNFARPTLGKADIPVAFEALPAGHEGWHLLFGDQTMDAAVSCLRGVIHAPPGHDFIDADYSSVENRMASYIAGQWDKIEMFSHGFDEYKTFASKRLFKVDYGAVSEQQRQFTKPVILGGIFGLGHLGLQVYAKQYGVDMSLEESKTAVTELRNEYRHVRDLWWECGDASIEATRNPGVWVKAGEKLSLIHHKGFLWMKLPNGRHICWARPLVEYKRAPWMEKFWVGYDEEGNDIYGERPAFKHVVTVESIDTKTRQFCRHPLIGSSIFQSAVQGSARDILAEGTMFAENAGYQTVLLAHDENLSLVREGWGDPDEFGELLITPTYWRKDLPLAYEAWRGKRFRK